MRIGISCRKVYDFDLRIANRHGLIAGATGTGKTVTLQTLAEGFSKEGVPVFVADIKGDLSGIAHTPGDVAYSEFWDVFGEAGTPIRTAIGNIRPLLLARMLELTKVQEGVLNVAYKYADDHAIDMVTLKDLRETLRLIGVNAREISLSHGNVTAGSVGAIQRQITAFEREGGSAFFGRPALDVSDFIRHSQTGRGIIDILSANKLIHSPRLYSTFLMWMLDELFRTLPEVGDADRPKFVFIFDEAHLLFDDGSDALEKMIERIVRLIRSKGVGVYFVTQSPADVPESILAQLSNRFQHALRAYTPRDERSVRIAAGTFRPNPKFSAADVITKLGVGEALVSTLDNKGVPGIVQRVKIDLPKSKLGPISDTVRQSILAVSDLYAKYKDAEPQQEMNTRGGFPVLPAVAALLVLMMAAPIGGCVYIGYLFFSTLN